jgi:hypothetical protein
MTGLIVLELMMMRQTGQVEGEQDVQYIDSWGEAGWRRCSASGSWSAKLLRFSDALCEAHTASSFEDSIDYRTKLPRQRASSLKDEVAMPHYAAQGPVHQAVMATIDQATPRSLSSCHRAWPLRITA